ncbi:MAG: lipid-A-disaccharide synthase [Chthoniobacter sp.]|jgi:lipid-A-disaccharide synthase|nr:lipid-A-disaccharide synthase [Chthoniobacter sp.]
MNGANENTAFRSILFLAGDVSGDFYAARLAEEIHARHPCWKLHALGGQNVAAAIKPTGGEWIADTGGCSAIGIAAVLSVYPRSHWLSAKMRRFVAAHQIDAVIMCDWGGFNCRHLRFFKRLGIPVLYYFPPRSWQRTGLPGLGIAPLVSRVATPFEWSARRLTAAGCEAEWVGHPLLESAHTPRQRVKLRQEFDLDADEKLVALLPGSRTTELNVLAPRMAAAAEMLRREHSAKFIVAVPDALAARARRFFPAAMRIVPGRAADALLACDVAIVKTGTATLEAAVIGAPQVAVYDFEWVRRIEWLLLWMWKKIPFVALPNIILQRMAVPELLGLDCRAEAIALSVGELLENEVQRGQMLAAYDEVRRLLGAALPVSATKRTAEMLDEMLGLRRETARGETALEM